MRIRAIAIYTYDNTGHEDHACAEGQRCWSDHQVQGLRGCRRQQRPRRPGRQVRQGGGHCYPRRYHYRQDERCAHPKGLLGQAQRQPTHSALQGDWQVRLSASPSHSSTPWYRCVSMSFYEPLISCTADAQCSCVQTAVGTCTSTCCV
jgi:hypothetical protein